MSQLVSIITATTGRDSLSRCIESVKQQTHPEIQHLIAIDGSEHRDRAETLLAGINDVDVIYLPYSTANFGGRIYSAMPALTKGSFIMNLDDDNTLEPDHVASLVASIGENPWAYSLRNVTNAGRFVMQDNCESLGPLHPEWWNLRLGIQHYFIDTGCFFLTRKTALELARFWAPTAFEDRDYFNDRIFFAALAKTYPQWSCSGKYTLNYEASEDRTEFFRQGNEWIRERYNGIIPWHVAERVAMFRATGKWG